MNNPIGPDVLAGQAAYTRTVVAVYDFMVIRTLLPFVWKCPTSRVVELYRANVSNNHLECGVGTGFFLNKCPMPPSQRLVLLDLNPNSLLKSAHRLKRFQPRTYARNVLQPLAIEEQKFDSVGMNFLLHCLPGNIYGKAIVFDSVLEYLKPGGCVFGSTLLQPDASLNFTAKRMMSVFNRRRIFCNTDDDLAGLRQELEKRFQETQIEIVGHMTLFRARKPKNCAG